MKDTQHITPHLSPEFIDFHAFGMVNALQKGGHLAYLVGGCVRDLLAGQIPKDFDISTSATPQQVKRLINFSFIIGKRFRLVLSKRGEKQYEIATFRREPVEGEFPEGVPFGDNIFGSPEQDAHRRDFTINGLFYDPVTDEVIDHVKGLEDVENKLIRMIGDPKIRLAEDPIRILRALRLSQKLHFRIDPDLRKNMSELANLIPLSVLPRRREEILKMLRLQDPTRVFREGFDLGLWEFMLPHLHKNYCDDKKMDTIEERLARIESRLVDMADTSFLFGTLITGWLRGHLAIPGDKIITHLDVIKTEAFSKFCKDELGLHNWEIARVNKALSLQKILEDVEGFQKRGPRRQQSIISNEAFPLAVDLAHIDGVLDPEILGFWEEKLEIARVALSTEPRERPHRPHRPRRRRRRPPG